MKGSGFNLIPALGPSVTVIKPTTPIFDQFYPLLLVQGLGGTRASMK